MDVNKTMDMTTANNRIKATSLIRRTDYAKNKRESFDQYIKTQHFSRP